MNKIEVYKIELKEIEQLQKVAKQTFLETFAESNTEENMQKYLNEGFTIEKLTSELTNQNSEFTLPNLKNR
jgi:diamine N-acetyltransferase